MSTTAKPQGKTTYVASAAEAQWLLNEQRKLYLRSWCGAIRPPLGALAQLCGNVYGEPGAYRKAHAGFGRGGSGDRGMRVPYGARPPLYAVSCEL